METKQYCSSKEVPSIKTENGRWTGNINFAIWYAEQEERIWEATVESHGFSYEKRIHQAVDSGIIPYSDSTMNEYVSPILQSWKNECKDLPHLYGDNDTHIHGMKHVARVVLFSLLIMSQLPQMTERERKLLITAAVFHDVGRETDYIESDHGMKSARKMLQIIDADPMKYDFTDSEKELLSMLVTYHCIDDDCFISMMPDNAVIEDKESAVFLYKILKDADALDRYRLGISFGDGCDGFDYRYLRLPESRKFALLASVIFTNANIDQNGTPETWTIR